MLQAQEQNSVPLLSNAALPRFSCDFSEIPVHHVKEAIQTKLTVSRPGDKYEQEADRVVDQVMRMTETQFQRPGPCDGVWSKREVEQPYQDRSKIKEVSRDTPRLGRHIQSKIGSLRGGGRPLPRETRLFFEARFSHDFNAVRIHDNKRAAAIANRINARAFTLGRDIGFAPGEYNPESPSGKRLLAHELVHTLQQRDASLRLVQRKDLPGALTTDDITSTCIDFGILAREMEDEVLVELYEAISHYYTIRDRDGMPDAERQTIKDNIRGLWEVLEEIGIAPRAALGSAQAGIMQAKSKTRSPESIHRLRASTTSQLLMRDPAPEAEGSDIDAETLAEIATENPYQNTRVQEITRAPGLIGRIPLPIPYNQIDPTTVKLVDIWGLGCGPC
jgi:hypothetical protein